MTTYKTDPFWIDDFSILFKVNKLGEMLPMNNMSTTQKLNAMLRFSIYFSVIYYLIKKNSNILFVPLVVSILTYVFYINNTENSKNSKNKNSKLTKIVEQLSNQFLGGKDEKKENLLFESIPNEDDTLNNDLTEDFVPERIRDTYEDDDCKWPSKENPFGNLMLKDIGNPKSEKACSSYNNNLVRRDQEKYWLEGLYQSTDELYSKSNSQRQFYTMPNTQAANEQTEFAKWLYLTPPTCKEGNGLQCSANLSNPNGLNISRLLTPFTGFGGT